MQLKDQREDRFVTIATATINTSEKAGQVMCNACNKYDARRGQRVEWMVVAPEVGREVSSDQLFVYER